MAVNLQNADNALKSVYLDVISEKLNKNLSPFFSAIKMSTEDVWGKEVRKTAIHGINGGIGAGTEDGDLPAAYGNNYGQFVTTLKNLYGVIEISDKAIRASENNSGAFVNLLNAEMEGLINASTFNFGRMLFGDGSGIVGSVLNIVDGKIILNSLRNVVEGMVIDFRTPEGNIISGCGGRRITAIKRDDTWMYVDGEEPTLVKIPKGTIVTVQGSYGNELTGLGALFDAESTTLYGMNKSGNSFLSPYRKDNVGSFSEMTMQIALDTIEAASGNAVNLILCSWGVRRAILMHYMDKNRTMPMMELAGGFKAVSFNGIPIVAERFCPEGTMYLLNTNDFTLHQLCDWQWLSDDDGRVLKQVPGKPVYTATLVKYADLICSHPNGQGILTGIIEA